MKSIYVRSVPGSFRPAIADVCADAGTGEYVITRINVPDVPGARGKGHGRALLVQIIDDADALGVTLKLTINSYGDLDYKALRSWYERYGFRESEDGWMRRPPAHVITGHQLSIEEQERMKTRSDFERELGAPPEAFGWLF